MPVPAPRQLSPDYVCWDSGLEVDLPCVLLPALPCSALPGRCKVNLLAFNSHEGSPFKPSSKEQIQAFRSLLIQARAGLARELPGMLCSCCLA